MKSLAPRTRVAIKPVPTDPISTRPFDIVVICAGGKTCKEELDQWLRSLVPPARLTKSRGYVEKPSAPLLSDGSGLLNAAATAVLDAMPTRSRPSAARCMAT